MNGISSEKMTHTSYIATCVNESKPKNTVYDRQTLNSTLWRGIICLYGGEPYLYRPHNNQTIFDCSAVHKIKG